MHLCSYKAPFSQIKLTKMYSDHEYYIIKTYTIEYR